MSNFRIWAFITIIAFLVGLAFLMGKTVGQPEIEARTVTVAEPAIQEVPVYVTQTEYIEVTRELKPFKSWHELQVWLANNYVRDATADRCVDTALELCQRAWRDGYQMSTELWGDGNGEGHMINSTVIGDNIYFIEPSSNSSWLGGVKESMSGK